MHFSFFQVEYFEYSRQYCIPILTSLWAFYFWLLISEHWAHVIHFTFTSMYSVFHKPRLTSQWRKCSFTLEYTLLYSTPGIKISAIYPSSTSSVRFIQVGCLVQGALDMDINYGMLFSTIAKIMFNSILWIALII